jgi:hypothetical protein
LQEIEASRPGDVRGGVGILPLFQEGRLVLIFAPVAWIIVWLFVFLDLPLRFVEQACGCLIEISDETEPLVDEIEKVHAAIIHPTSFFPQLPRVQSRGRHLVAEQFDREAVPGMPLVYRSWVSGAETRSRKPCGRRVAIP